MAFLPKLSVVIATYNRAETIPITLGCLARQTLGPDEFEVILVDDGSPDNTEMIVAGEKKKLPYALTYMRHKNRGICYTQNRGIREANAPLILLIADDIFLEPEALALHIKDHESHPEPNIAILGKVVQSPELAKYSVFLKKWDPFKFNRLKALRSLPYYMFWACQISFKKNFLTRFGLFNENLVIGGADGHEDVELGCRLAKHGLRILYNPKALGYHFHLMQWSQVVRKYYKKGLTWQKFRNQVGIPEISVKYHVLNSDTLRDYIKTLQNENNLMGADKSLILLMVRHLGHGIFFNRFLVNFFWMPLIEVSEKNTLAKLLMSSWTYRCVLFHFFSRGVNDNRAGRHDKRLMVS